MKNTLIVASLVLLTTITYGQTKEETIEWLNNNMELLVTDTYCNRINEDERAIDNFKIENDSLIQTRKWQGGVKNSVAIKDLLFQDTNLNNSSDKPYITAFPYIVCVAFQSKKIKSKTNILIGRV